MKVEEEDGNAAAARALKLIEDYDGTLVCLLICNNIVNITSASLTTLIFTDLFGPTGVGYATVVVTSLVIVFGEVMPKSFANESAEVFLKISSTFLVPIKIVLKPLIFLIRKLRDGASKLVRGGKEAQKKTMTEQELKVVLDEIEDDGVIEEEHTELMKSALQFSDRDAGDIITHRVDVTAMPINATTEEIKEIFIKEQFSRLPIYRDSIDNIVGILRQKDFFAALLMQEHPNVEELMQKPLYVPPGMSLMQLLRLMDKQKTLMAIVVDSFGGTEGIVTMEDIVEELIGEIWDEYDEVTGSILDVSGGYSMSGDTLLSDLYDLVDIKVPKDKQDITGAVFILEQTGEIPEAGRSVEDGYFKYTVTEVADQRIKTIRAELLDNAD